MTYERTVRQLLMDKPGKVCFYSLCSGKHLTRRKTFLLFNHNFVVWSVFINRIQASRNISKNQASHTPKFFLQCCTQWSPNSLGHVLTKASSPPEHWFTTTEANKLQPCAWPGKSVLLNDSVILFVMIFMPRIPNEALSTNRRVGKTRHFCFVYFSPYHFLSVTSSISFLFLKINSFVNANSA